MVSMFRLEIIADKVVCFVNCKEFLIKSDFGNTFSLYLDFCKNSIKVESSNQTKEKSRFSKNARRKNSVLYKQTVDIMTPVQDLLENMLIYPLNLTMEIKHNKNTETGSVQIAWRDIFLEFLNISNIEAPDKAHKITEIGKYDLYHDITSKRVATLRLKITLSYINPEVNSENNSTFLKIQSGANSSTYITKENNLNPGIIKTKYRGKELSEYVKRHAAKKYLDLEKKYSNKSEEFTSKEELRNKLSSIFMDDSKSYFSKQIFCLGYCTIENIFEEETKHPVSERSSIASTKKSSALISSNTKSSQNEIAGSLIEFTECENITCNNKLYKEVSLKDDSKILVTLQNLKTPCCEKTPTDKVKVNFANTDDDSCYCACECNFGFTKKSTYCNVCGGYEIKGTEQYGRLKYDLPHPCPLYHKLMDINKSRSLILTASASGSRKSLKLLRSKSQTSYKKRSSIKDFERRNTGSHQGSITSYKIENKKEIDKKTKKEGRKTGIVPEIEVKTERIDKDERFKFNYGYQAPQIGHSRCNIPRHGPVLNNGSNVPKNMGWLWNSENIPGMKSRPSWKPGATHKQVVQLLKVAKNPGTKTSKKRRKSDSRKRRKNDKKPLLIVHKKDGEYNVTMETMKLFQKQRTINQYPYEDKPALAYTVGRTDEENLERSKKRTRVHRRLEREKRDFIESSFKNMCEEICVKTYQQAIGILPGTEEPDCPCFPALPDPEKYSLNRSCSCSEDKNSIDSETDSDEWLVEFTPPNAKFDPVYKVRRTMKIDNTTQYDYLDYRVKILSTTGSLIPRFFKGPDGKQQCSDLGGFWGPDKTWLEINVDGYIAADGRWAPESFAGPNGEQIETKTGKFQTVNGNWLVVGIDGYIDLEGKWKFYRGKRERKKHPTQNIGNVKRTGGSGDRKFNKGKATRIGKKRSAHNSVTTWSCFGDNISPKYLTEMGILGHGQDKLLLKKSITEMIARGVNVKMPQTFTSHTRNDKKHSIKKSYCSHNQEQHKCHHAVPSAKGIVAVDEFGNKVYFKLRNYRNSRPRERVQVLEDKGISMSSFHVPCLSSFISSEVIKEQQRKRIFELAAKHNA